MRRILLAVGLLLAALPAYAQTTQQYTVGPSLGNVVAGAGGYLAGIRATTTTTEPILTTDAGYLIIFNNGSAVASALPQAGTVGFEKNKRFHVLNLGAGTVTITPTTSTINGASTKTYAQNASGTIVSDGTNYFAY